MTKVKFLFLTLLTAVLLRPGTAWSQCFEEQSLGDAAREQQKVDGQKKPTERKVYRNRDIASTPSEPTEHTATTTNNNESSPGSTSNGPSIASALKEKKDAQDVSSQPHTPQNSTLSNTTSIFDRPKEPDEDVTVVPAGTLIEVDLATNTVSLPVRVGFATPIPASSKVTTHVFGNSNCEILSGPTPVYGFPCNSDGYPTLTSVTVGEVTYPVQADGFLLTAPLVIQRYETK